MAFIKKKWVRVLSVALCVAILVSTTIFCKRHRREDFGAKLRSIRRLHRGCRGDNAG